MPEENILGLVPARGGSKGIEGKNIVDIAGKPLISYVLEALEASPRVDKIVCTTDSEEIADVARQYGAEVPFMRPAEMARDDSSIFRALSHAAKKTKAETGFAADYVVTAQPTYPLLEAGHVNAVVDRVLQNDADSAITAVELDHLYHPYNIRQMDDDGRVSFWKEELHFKYPNRQQKPTFYHFGNVYATEYELLAEQERLEGRDNFLVEIDWVSSWDIDTPEDIELAEYFIRKQRGGSDA